MSLIYNRIFHYCRCLLYTSDAADERSSVDLGGRRIIKKKKRNKQYAYAYREEKKQYDDMNVRI